MPTPVLKSIGQVRALVHGLVDAIQHPAFIISPSQGFIVSNESAKSLRSKGLDVQAQHWEDGQIAMCNEETYRTIGKRLNHKTDFILFELHNICSPLDRMRAANQVLDAMLQGEH
ncbi:MAG: hypothetical protein JSS66_04690 [Armatimonadetes bacterium]|nr:hypothetical protein [Armatimonadota bacterium]